MMSRIHERSLSQNIPVQIDKLAAFTNIGLSVHRLYSGNNKEKTMSYSFTVRSASEVDFQRICNEAPDCKDVILIVCKYGAAAMIRTAFLEGFNVQDGLLLGKDILCGWWGSLFSPDAKDYDSAIRFENDATTKVDGWRSYYIDKRLIGEFCAQLQAARAFNPVRKVRVEYP